MNFFILYFPLLTLIFSCTKMPPHEKAGYTAINTHIKNMGNSEHWLPQSIGGSFYDGDIKQLFVSFITTAEYFNVEYTRALMVKGIETFLASINSNEQLVPHLNHHPFSYQDIKYGISLYTTEGKWLGHAFLIKGDLVFFKTNELRSPEQKRTEQVHEELYPEALHKIRAGLAVPVLQFPGRLS